MATATIEDVTGNGHATLVTWVLTDADTSGDPAMWVEYADRNIQMTGTFNGGTVVIEGSNDGANWHPLSDPQGNALTFTSGKIEQILEVTKYTRPRITSGTGLTVTVLALCRRSSRS
jgi:hypothetical protein